jgi:hypothetical protein
MVLATPKTRSMMTATTATTSTTTPITNHIFKKSIPIVTGTTVNSLDVQHQQTSSSSSLYVIPVPVTTGISTPRVTPPTSTTATTNASITNSSLMHPPVISSPMYTFPNHRAPSQQQQRQSVQQQQHTKQSSPSHQQPHQKRTGALTSTTKYSATPAIPSTSTTPVSSYTNTDVVDATSHQQQPQQQQTPHDTPKEKITTTTTIAPSSNDDPTNNDNTNNTVPSTTTNGIPANLPTYSSISSSNTSGGDGDGDGSTTRHAEDTATTATYTDDDNEDEDEEGTGGSYTENMESYETDHHTNNASLMTNTTNNTYDNYPTMTNEFNDTNTFDDGTNSIVLLNPNKKSYNYNSTNHNTGTTSIFPYYNAMTAKATSPRTRTYTKPSTIQTSQHSYNSHTQMTDDENEDETTSIQHQCQATAQCSPCFHTPLSSTSKKVANKHHHNHHNSSTSNKKQQMTNNSNNGTNKRTFFHNSNNTQATTPKLNNDITNILSNDSTVSEMTNHSTSKYIHNNINHLHVHDVSLNYHNIVNDNDHDNENTIENTPIFNTNDDAINVGGDNNDNTNNTNTNTAGQWWLQIFQQLEQQHTNERTQLQNELHYANQKQSQYKSELKSTIHQQLVWLEERMMLPQHILPNLKLMSTKDNDGSHSTEATVESSSSEENRHMTHTTTTNNNNNNDIHNQRQHHPRSTMYQIIDGTNEYSNFDDPNNPANGITTVQSWNNNNMGIEITYDSMLQQQRIQELEQCLTDTIHQYQKDRLEWVRTLEEAATLTTAGEQLNIQQQEQMVALQSQISSSHKKQRKQWKEKILVLQDLLKLTECQHMNEKQEWDEQRIKHETTIQQLTGDMNDLLKSMENMSQENVTFQQAVNEYQQKLISMEQMLKNSIINHENDRNQLEQQHDIAMKHVRDEAEHKLSLLQQELQQQHEKEITQKIEETMKLQQRNMEKKIHLIQLNAQQEKEEMTIEMNHLRNDAVTYLKEIEQLKNDALQHEKDMELIRNDYNALSDESQTFRAYAADYTEQAAVSRNQCTVLQKNLQALTDSPNVSHTKSLSTAIITSSSSSALDLLSADLDNKLDRAIAQRDLYQQEAISLQSEKTELQHQIEQLQQQLKNSQQRIEEDRIAQSVTVKDIPSAKESTFDVTDHVKQNDELSVKYRDSVEKNGELVSRIKRIEEQRMDERNVWKLQLEAALAESRTLHDEQMNRDIGTQQITEQYTTEVNALKLQLQQVRMDRKRQFDELIRLCGNTNGILSESNVIQHLQERIDNLENEMEQRCQTFATNHTNQINEYTSQIEALNQSIRELEQEMEYRCDQLIEKHYLELSELKDRFEDVEHESHETIVSLQQQQHVGSSMNTDDGDDDNDENDDDETQVVSNTKKQLKFLQQQRQLNATIAENNTLIDRVDELSRSLVEYQRLHQSATKKYERAILDRNGYKNELETLRRKGNEYTAYQEVASRFERHQFIFLNAIEELHDEIKFIRQNIDGATSSTIETERNKINQLSTGLSNVQSALNSAIDDTAKGNEDEMWKKQEKLVSELTALCKQMKNTRVGQRSDKIAANIEKKYNEQDTYILYRELISELLQKESVIAIAQTELRHCKEQLESEISSRQIAEGEIVSLNEQADMYENEISNLQFANTKLIKKLRDMGIHLDATLLAGYMRSACSNNNEECNSAVGSPRLRTGHNKDDSLIVLDEALALAEDLTNIVHCRSASCQREPTAMEMLESMSEMMDVHELRSASQDVSSPRGGSPQQSRQRRHRKVFDNDGEDYGIEVIHEVDDDDDDDDDDSSSINWFRENNKVDSSGSKLQMNVQRPTRIETTALQGNAQMNECKLQLVVEQLYGRCQLLERERVEMMEVTIDLLESAREANSAQLEAALATARRKSTEDMLRVRDQCKQEQERIFHKLCKSYIVQQINEGGKTKNN